MKLVFAHDHCFFEYNHTYYSTGSLAKNMLERYSSVFKQVTVISRQKRLESLNDKLTLASAQAVRFEEIPNFKTLKGLTRFFKAKKKIEKEVKSSDYVIARMPSAIGSLAIDAAKKYHKPYLVEVVACPLDALWNHSLRGKMMAPFGYMNMKKRVKNAPYVVYVTKRFLQERYPTKGKTVSCSNVALQDFNEQTLKTRLAKIQKKKKEDQLIIGTIGAVNVKHKGQQFMIQALGELKKQGGPMIEYHLVGGGSAEFLKRLAKKYDVEECVKFLGVMPHEKVFEWLETIDLYVQPSRQEGLPRALIEAMSRGVPAFGAKTAGIPELLEEQFIFSNSRKNIQEICMILKKFNQQVMKEQAKRNYKEAKQYSKEKIERRRKAFFMQLRDKGGMAI